MEEALESDGLLIATLTLDPVSSLPTVQGGPYGGWYWLGTVEQRALRHPDWQQKRDLIAKRYRVVEVRDADDRQALSVPPVGNGDVRLWRAAVEPTTAASRLDSSQPLIGIDREVEMVGDGREGLGVPGSLLVPLASLLSLLGLRPGPPCTYGDDDGAGLALVVWRAEYDVSDYYLAWPRTRGSGIVIRPDLLLELAAAAGEDRVVMRDFVVGSSELADAAPHR